MDIDIYLHTRIHFFTHVLNACELQKIFGFSSKANEYIKPYVKLV